MLSVVVENRKGSIVPIKVAQASSGDTRALFESSGHNLNVFVPEDYVHGRQLNTFSQNYGHNGVHGVVDPRIIDRNFHAVVPLEPGATYSADFYQVVQWGHVSPT